MGQCWRLQRSSHQRLVDDRNSQERVSAALVTLAEITHSHDANRRHLDIQIQENQNKLDAIAQLFRKKKLTREDAMRAQLPLENLHRSLQARFVQATTAWTNAKEHEATVEDFHANIDTTLKMNSVVEQLDKAGCHLNPEAVAVKVADVMADMRESTQSQHHVLTDSMPTQFSENEEEARESIYARLDRIAAEENDKERLALTDMDVAKNYKAIKSAMSEVSLSSSKEQPFHQIVDVKLVVDEDDMG